MVTFLQRAAEFVFVYFFQCCLYVAGIYFVGKKDIQWKQFFLCAFLSMLATYTIRQFPINFGIHTILSMIFLIFIAILILKIQAQSVVKGVLIITVSVLILEGFYVLLLKAVLGEERFLDLINNAFLKEMSGVPVNIVLFICLLFLYLLRKRKLRVDK